jgi:hypothetical protein
MIALPWIIITVHRGASWKIAVYGREHGVPHFHTEGPDFRRTAGFRTLEVIVGTAPTATVKEACAWARKNRATVTTKSQ